MVQTILNAISKLSKKPNMLQLFFLFLKTHSIYFVAACFLPILSFPSNRNHSILDKNQQVV